MLVEYKEKKYRKFGEQWYECITNESGNLIAHMRVHMILNGELSQAFPNPKTQKKIVKKEDEAKPKKEKPKKEKPKKETKKSGNRLSKAAFRSLLTKK